MALHLGFAITLARHVAQPEDHHGVRLTVENQPEVLVRFSQRALNTAPRPADDFCCPKLPAFVQDKLFRYV